MFNSDSRFDAIYCRQSVEKEDSLSIQTQMDFAEKLCSGEIRYYSDPGYSGKNIKRPDMQRLMQDVQSGKIRKVVIYRLDRLTRSLFDLVDLWKVFDNHNVSFVSATEQLDTSTSIGKMFVMLMIMIAEWERENTVKRITDNYYKRAELGRWVGGPSPFSYELSTFVLQGQSIKSLDVNWERMDLEIEIRKKYLDPNVSLGKIKKELNEKGIKTNAGKNWSENTLSRIMRNPTSVKATPAIYAFFKQLGTEITSPIDQFTGEFGCLLVGKSGASTRQRKKIAEAKLSVGSWPGVIEPDLYLKNMERLQRNIRLGRTGTGLNTWLSGIIKCPFCEKAMAVKHYTDRNDIRRSYLWCTGRYTDICEHKSDLRIYEVEQVLEREIQILLDEAEPEEIVPAVSGDEIAIQVELVKIDEKITKALEAIYANGVSDTVISYINKTVESLDRQKEALNQELNQILHKKSKSYVPEKLVFQELNFDEKKAIAKTYLERVYIDKDFIDVIWKI